MRTCKRCGATENDQPFPKWGLTCQFCENERARQRRARLQARTRVPIPQTKVCSRCEEEKPADEFYGNLQNVDGLMGKCKACHDALPSRREDGRRGPGSNHVIELPNGSRRKITPDGAPIRLCSSAREGIRRLTAAEELVRERWVGRVCPRCHELKPLRRFYEHRSGRNGRSSWCRVCVRATYRARYAANLTAERERVRRWKHANPVKVAEQGDRRWRRAARQNAGTVTAEFVDRLLCRARRCHWCGEATPRDDRTIDHVIPLAAGGAHCRSNLCMACASCNASKGARTPDEWSAGKQRALPL